MTLDVAVRMCSLPDNGCDVAAGKAAAWVGWYPGACLLVSTGSATGSALLACFKHVRER